MRRFPPRSPRLPLVAVTGAALLFASWTSSALADTSVQMTEGSLTDITTWGFTPPEITVSAGESITWTNSGSQAHSATAASGGTFDTGLVAPGDSKSVTLSTPGTYAYQCTPHPWMKGSIVVQAAAAAAPAAAPVAAPTAPAAAPVAAAPAAQAQGAPTPFRFLTPTPVAAARPVASTTAAPPRAGGMPDGLLLILLAGGIGAVSGGVYILRRDRPRA